VGSYNEVEKIGMIPTNLNFIVAAEQVSAGKKNSVNGFEYSQRDHRYLYQYLPDH